MSLEAFSGGYFRYQQRHLNLCFELQTLGANWVAEIPQDVMPVLFFDERFIFVEELLKSYRVAIAAIGKSFGWTAPESPVACCAQFSELLVGKKMHQWTELSLESLGISILPPQISLFRQLTHLDLSGNKLKRLFPELLSLGTLEVLDVSGNENIMLPDLSALPRLRMIKANGCCWSEIPAWMEESASLEEVELKNNKIQVCPQGLKKAYELSGNPIKV